jgi:peptide/nickel transport system permease protein
MSTASSAVLDRGRGRSRVARWVPKVPGLDFVGHLALTFVILFALLAILGPLLAPHDPNAVDLSKSYWGPDLSHPLGYDGQGRDILSRLLVGARSSFLGPLTIVLIATVGGLAVAVTAAWRGGWIDAALAGVLDAAMSFPGLLLAVLVVAIVGPGLMGVVIALGLAYIPYVARVIRSAALAEMGKDYVNAQWAQGFTAIRICVFHVVPNLMTFVAAQAALTLAWATVDLAGLSFLGLGVQPPSADWGVMVQGGQSGVIAGYPMESLAAGVCLVGAVCSFSVLGRHLLRRAEEDSR